MRPISTISGSAIFLGRGDIDTDQIIPQQFLKRVERDGYGDFLFYNWAHHDDGSPNQEFETNNPRFRGATVLITGPNFGCGSSREHAVWAILGWGIQAVLAPSIADIFKANAANNGLLTVELPTETIEKLGACATTREDEVVIDLKGQSVRCGGDTFPFDIDPVVRERLLKGVDLIGATLDHHQQIARYEQSRDPWLPRLGVDN